MKIVQIVRLSSVVLLVLLKIPSFDGEVALPRALSRLLELLGLKGFSLFELYRTMRK